MTNILYLITDLNIGGTEKMLYEIVTKIDKNKYYSVVVGLKGWGEFAQRLSNSGIKTYVLDIYKNKLLVPFKFLTSIIILITIIRAEKIEFIHSFLFQANIFAKIVGLIYKIPVITSVRVMEKEKKWQLTFEKFTSNLTIKIIVNSIALKNFLIENAKIPESKIHIIYNGININNSPIGKKEKYLSEFGFNENDIIITTVIRLHKQKGIIYLIEAINLFKNLKLTQLLKFVIVGDGPERKKLQELVGKLNLSDTVKFTGFRNDSLEIISISDIFVLSSLWEGTPNVILEAMLYSKPIISTNVGGVAELIENKISGLLVSPEDPKSLFDSIKFLIENPSYRETFGKNANKCLLSFFSVDKMIKQFENLYTSL